jgi:hypothetical protein
LLRISSQPAEPAIKDLYFRSFLNHQGPGNNFRDSLKFWEEFSFYHPVFAFFPEFFFFSPSFRKK